VLNFPPIVKADIPPIQSGGFIVLWLISGYEI